jgi:phosphohistidine phosphatase
VKTLHLLRHAKSSWADTGLADHDRPLAPRGRRSAQKIAEHLRQQSVSPATVLCSSAIRSRETLALVAPALGRKTTIEVEDELYAAPVEALLQRLRRIPDLITSVMLIGHNPGLQDLALTLAGRGAKLERLREGFPTAALVTLRIPAASWRELGPGDAELVDYVVPREL